VSPARALLIVASVAGIGWMLRALVLDPPPLVHAFVALGAYLALVVVGLACPALAMFVDVVTEGPRDARGVALTIDVEDAAAAKALAPLLEGHALRATLFVRRAVVEEIPETLASLVAAGHELALLGNAGLVWSRRALEAELDAALTLLATLDGGRRPVAFRAASRTLAPALASIARTLRFDVVDASVTLGAHPSARDEAVIGSAARDGAIVRVSASRLMRGPALLEALGATLGRLQLASVTLATWFASEDGDEVSRTPRRS